MKILWFCNSPCGSVRRYNKKILSGGWLVSLEEQIKKCDNISLFVAYLAEKKEIPFEYDLVNYIPIYRKSSNNGVKRVLSRFRSLRKSDNEVLPRLIDTVMKVKPDLIHIHGTEECFGLIQDVIKDIPIVFSIQGMIAPYKEKYFTGMSFADVKQYESFSDKIRGVSVVNAYKSFCYRSEREKNYLKQARYIFGRTFWDRYCTLALNPQRKYYVVNEILRSEFYEKQWKGFFSKNKIQIVSTISGGIYKGMETVLKAADILQRYGTIDFEWHIAGYNKSTKWLKIAERITKLQYGQCNIVLHGRIDAIELVNLLSESDMYVHVSHIENSPNSVCEAMLMGMPVIASYTGGTASLLAHDENGILYQDGDPYVLAGAIVELVQNPGKAVAYGRAAREQALLRHNKLSIVNELLDGYRKILNDSR